MTLQEVARDLAGRMQCQVEQAGNSGKPGENPGEAGEHVFEVRVNGTGYYFVVASFFGGWQATLHLPGVPAVTFYAEAVEMLEARLKAKLSGRDANF